MDPSSVSSSVKNFTREELESHAKEDGNVVYEWEYDKPKKILDPKEAATAFMEIHEAFLKTREAMPHLEDEAIRELIKKSSHPLVKDFYGAYENLFERITDRTTTAEMMGAYKMMLVMKEQEAKGEFTHDGATSIVKDYVDKMTTRDATDEELRTGQVKEKMWEGNPLTKREREDPLNKGPKAAKEQVKLDPSRMRKVEPRSEAQVSKDEVNKAVREMALARSRVGLVTALRKLRHLIEKTPEGVPIDVEGLDRAFRMKQSAARGVWDRDVSALVGRILGTARSKNASAKK